METRSQGVVPGQARYQRPSSSLCVDRKQRLWRPFCSRNRWYCFDAESAVKIVSSKPRNSQPGSHEIAPKSAMVKKRQLSVCQWTSPRFNLLGTKSDSQVADVNHVLIQSARIKVFPADSPRNTATPSESAGPSSAGCSRFRPRFFEWYEDSTPPIRRGVPA